MKTKKRSVVINAVVDILLFACIPDTGINNDFLSVFHFRNADLIGGIGNKVVSNKIGRLREIKI